MVSQPILRIRIIFKGMLFCPMVSKSLYSSRSFETASTKKRLSDIPLFLSIGSCYPDFDKARKINRNL